MAVRDVVADIQSIASGSYLDIQPASGTEIVIHNIVHASDATLNRYDDTNSIDVETQYGSGGWFGYFLHANNTDRWRVKNSNSSAALIGYDGIVTK